MRKARWRSRAKTPAFVLDDVHAPLPRRREPLLRIARRCEISSTASSDPKFTTCIRAARRRHSAHVTFRHQSNDVPQALLNLQPLQRQAAAAIYSKATAAIRTLRKNLKASKNNGRRRPTKKKIRPAFIEESRLERPARRRRRRPRATRRHGRRPFQGNGARQRPLDLLGARAAPAGARFEKRLGF